MTRVSLQLQQGLSIGIAAVSRDSPVEVREGKPIRREAVGGADLWRNDQLVRQGRLSGSAKKGSDNEMTVRLTTR